MKVFNFIHDAGHGWIKVDKNFFNSLNILNKISSYSYQDEDNYFLEEDCDAYVFVEALKNKNINFSFNERIFNGYCFVRNLQSVK
jgi:alcohol dehydrogenase YqhD (iron-dependent ADH family)